MPAPLRTAFWNYDRTLALIDGRVEVEGFKLAIEVLRPEITFAKAFSEAAFDVCEISFSNTVTAVSKQDFPYALIPVFLSRAFRHSAVFIRTDRGIARPEDLRGKTVGLQEYDMTAAVVVRGFLRDQYGVEPRDIAWKVGELERTKPLEFPLGRPPEGVSIEILPPDRSFGGAPACGRAGRSHRLASAGGLARSRSADRAPVPEAYRSRKGVVQGDPAFSDYARGRRPKKPARRAP
jgi:4,5-dihydroxyphthalate decarboxylase